MDDIVDINTLFGPFPSSSADLVIDDLLGLMDRHQVNAACTLSTLGILLDPVIGNSATRAACAEQVHLIPVATLNPAMFFGDTTALSQFVNEGFRLLRFFPAGQRWKIDFAPFHWLLRHAQDTGLPIMIDIDQIGDITDLTRALEGNDAVVILSTVDHDTLAEAIAALQMFPNWHIETSRLLAPGCLRTAAECVGADRILFGTGAPAHPIASSLHTVRYSGLDKNTIDMILGTNARRVLNLA